ncbi:MAG TPA: ATP-binding cassette domain-containing protein [Candidatus Syntrophoarchaeum butanivorans]|uniref:ATP-binding cassette domain-containing protein n=1 Tax=Candidatus Syntropharchaeum butanivorans TaxID=1839936 RepID=A0A7C1B6L6_9EURY|nr:ATP-binding cassette domain-containing protein [Candidatus Syntrophoarchaeum butanivorans]
MPDPAIETRDLLKQFEDLTAVDRVNLEIREGELFGILGPNGAGKSTIVKMLTTLLKPTAGSAKVWGYDIIRDQDMVRAHIGVVFQDPTVDNKLTARENLDFHARMYGLNREMREQRIRDVLRLVELEDKADVLLEKYSGGMQRRLEIARGLMHHPNILFLDEPTLGLDAQTRRRIWDYVKEMNRKDHVTIVLTTHYMEEADFLCDRVAIIDHGRIVVCESPDVLKDQIRSEEIPDPSLEDVFLHFTGREIRDEDVDLRYHSRRIMRHWRMKRR